MTFGPLPQANQTPRHSGGPGRRRAAGTSARGDSVAGRSDILALASLVLGYPDDDLSDALPDIAKAVAALPRGAATADLQEFLTWFSGAEPAARRVEYVRTFDHKRRSALYVTFAPYGDSRQRGTALASLRQRYHDAGFAESGDELPDYLPTVLQFAALAGGKDADEVLGQSQAGIASIKAALEAQRSPYAAVLRAVTRCLPRRQAPIDVAAPELEGALA